MFLLLLGLFDIYDEWYKYWKCIKVMIWLWFFLIWWKKGWLILSYLNEVGMSIGFVMIFFFIFFGWNDIFFLLIYMMFVWVYFRVWVLMVFSNVLELVMKVDFLVFRKLVVGESGGD